MTQTTEKPKTMDIVPTPKERDFALLQREAQALAASNLMPEAFRGNIPNVLIVMNLARRTGFDVLAVAQNLDVIHGRPSFRATFLIACINACGRFTPLKYRFSGEGDERTCVAYANDRETGEEIEGPPVSIAMAKAEGWYAKNGSKWKTMADLMMRYRSAAFFSRTVAPEVSLGMMTSDEIEDMRTNRREGTTARSASEALASARDVTPPATEPDPVGDEFVDGTELDGKDDDGFDA